MVKFELNAVTQGLIRKTDFEKNCKERRSFKNPVARKLELN